MRHKRSIPNRGFRIADQIQRDLAELIRELPGVAYMMVNDAGASVYSASKLGAEEFPTVSVSDSSLASCAASSSLCGCTTIRIIHHIHTTTLPFVIISSIVHGRGTRSPNNIPVMRNKVRLSLSQRDEVLAFCDAAPSVGGSGAVDVLLKST